jgi:ABC-type multidrug transport system ATPase subunit
VLTVQQLIVIASIHQPATSTFMMFDRLLLLCQGHTAYNGPVDRIAEHFHTRGFPVPEMMNLAEFVVDFVNTDFARGEEVERQLGEVTSSWYPSEQKKATDGELSDELVRNSMGVEVIADTTYSSTPSFLSLTATLIHRSFLKSYRDIVVYGIRVAMYLGLALLSGYAWSRARLTYQPL